MDVDRNIYIDAGLPPPPVPISSTSSNISLHLSHRTSFNYYSRSHSALPKHLFDLLHRFHIDNYIYIHTSLLNKSTSQLPQQLEELHKSPSTIKRFYPPYDYHTHLNNMPLGLSTKKSTPVASKPEAMSSEVTLVGQSNTMSEKEAAAGKGPNFHT